jgi:hypothetical protein
MALDRRSLLRPGAIPWHLPRTRTWHQSPHQQTTAHEVRNALIRRLIRGTCPPADMRRSPALRDQRQVMSIWRSKVT